MKLIIRLYIKEVTGEDYTAKDFRTWAGSVHALCAFKELEDFTSESHSKKQLVEVIDQVAAKLGNTRTVCKKYYVHPSVISAHQSGAIKKYKVRENPKSSLSSEERLLVKILENEKIAKVF